LQTLLIAADLPGLCKYWCEYDTPAEGGFELHFKNHTELLDYCKTRFKKVGAIPR